MLSKKSITLPTVLKLFHLEPLEEPFLVFQPGPYANFIVEIKAKIPQEDLEKLLIRMRSVGFVRELDKSKRNGNKAYALSVQRRETGFYVNCLTYAADIYNLFNESSFVEEIRLQNCTLT